MLLSVAMILLMGLLAGNICTRLKLPTLLGMLAVGVLLGPYGLDLLDSSLLAISAEIRKMALIIILTRAGLGLDLGGLKKNGRPAFLMCFVPASTELLAVLLLGPALLGLSRLEAAILGAVLAAVSPAVVVPRMVKLMDTGYGTKQGVPQMILAGASVDDVYVIVLFSTFTGIANGNGIDVVRFVNIPVSILLGVAAGLLMSRGISLLFNRFAMRDTVKVCIMLSLSFLLCTAEEALKTPITFSALIAVMVMGMGMQKNAPQAMGAVSAQYGKLWIVGEVFLFVLVGAAVNIHYFGRIGVRALILIALALVFRMAGVLLCVTGSSLSAKERLFTMLAYTPKATVQAAIGGVPLAMGLACGESVLAVAVMAIVITAPLGAFAIDRSYARLLTQTAEAAKGTIVS